jgi:hypothetical protein
MIKYLVEICINVCTAIIDHVSAPELYCDDAIKISKAYSRWDIKYCSFVHATTISVWSDHIVQFLGWEYR